MENILEPGDVFYFSGVTPAISKYVKDTVRSALKYCKENDIQVICDLNYRGKMWSKEQAQVVMRDLMQYVNVCIANDEDFEATLASKPLMETYLQVLIRLILIKRVC